MNALLIGCACAFVASCAIGATYEPSDESEQRAVAHALIIIESESGDSRDYAADLESAPDREALRAWLTHASEAELRAVARQGAR